MKPYYVYILRCRDASYYIGITNNLERRLEEHVGGINKRCYTYSRRPLELVFYEEFSDPNKAIEYEKRLKGWSRKKKEALINSNWEQLKELSVCRNSSSHFNFRKE